MSGDLVVKVDPASLAPFANEMRAAGKRMPVAIARALNHTGAKARTQVVRVLTPQTGLKRQVIVRAVKSSSASAGNLAFTLRSEGGNIKLKYFRARETGKGVSAAPWGHRRVYAGSFINGGRFPKRVPLKKGGQVWIRTGKSKLPITLVRSGLYIPKEMVSGETAETFTTVVERDLPPRLLHELTRVL